LLTTIVARRHIKPVTDNAVFQQNPLELERI